MPEQTQDTQTTIKYALRDRASGRFARLDEDDCCSRSSYALSDDSRFPLFEADTPEALAQALLENTPSYNSCATRPSWGPWRSADELEVVKVTTVQHLEVVPLPELPCTGRTIELRDIPNRVAERYAGRKLELRADVEPVTVFWLAELPPRHTLESAQAWVGKDVYMDGRWNKRTVYAVVQAPDDYADLVAGKNAALLIASALVP